MNDKTKKQHLQSSERLEIKAFLKKRKSRHEIASLLGRALSTVSDEIRRNKVNGIYDPRKAQHKAFVRRKNAKYQAMKIIKYPELREYVEAKLGEDWSPQLISGRIKYFEQKLPDVSKNCIYTFLDSAYGASLAYFSGYLDRSRNWGRSTARASGLTDRTFIDKRPKKIASRRFFGDWEGDFIVSGKDGKGALLVLVERKSRYVIICKLMNRSTANVNTLLQTLLGGMLYVNSLTLDNDISFAKHQALSRALGAPVFFCHPYHSWEKGSVEQTNKLIRRYVPKGADISKVSNAEIAAVAVKLNARPRVCLKFATPEEVMRKHAQCKVEISGLVEQMVRLQKQNTLVGCSD